MSGLVYIPNHADLAEARLPEQYKGKPGIVAMARLFGNRAQPLEDVLWDLLSNSAIADAHDALLDQIGDIIGQPRNGLGDSLYKIRIVAKIGQNVSKGTPEHLIRIFKALMQADRVYYIPDFPAGFQLQAIGGTPLGTIAEVKAAMNASRLAGVSINILSSTDSISFSFSDDPDPNGAGFGDFNDGTIGGTLAQIL